MSPAVTYLSHICHVFVTCPTSHIYAISWYQYDSISPPRQSISLSLLSSSKGVQNFYANIFYAVTINRISFVQEVVVSSVSSCISEYPESLCSPQLLIQLTACCLPVSLSDHCSSRLLMQSHHISSSISHSSLAMYDIPLKYSTLFSYSKII